MGIRLDALPALEYLWSLLGHAAEAEGITIGIANYGGYRTEADTADILRFRQQEYDAYAARERAAGRVPVAIDTWRRIAPFGTSMHNYGAARDFVVPRRPPGMSYATAQRRVQELAESIGLRSGRTFGDDPHLELPISLEEAADEWARSSLEYRYTGELDVDFKPALAILSIGLGVFLAARYAKGAKSWD